MAARHVAAKAGRSTSTRRARNAAETEKEVGQNWNTLVKIITYPDDGYNEHDSNEGYNSPVKPLLAVLQIKPHLRQIPHKV